MWLAGERGTKSYWWRSGAAVAGWMGLVPSPDAAGLPPNLGMRTLASLVEQGREISGAELALLERTLTTPQCNPDERAGVVGFDDERRFVR